MDAQNEIAYVIRVKTLIEDITRYLGLFTGT